MRLLVVGAGGQLGQAMVRRLSAAHDVVARTRTELDVTALDRVMTDVRAVRPDGIINCAAYANVDAAEREPVSALAVNAWGPLNLARAAHASNALLVHFSTDFVFDGDTSRPYVETDATRPQGTYGTSKLLGEWLAGEHSRSYVLRVESLFGGPRAKSSVDMLRNSIRAGQEARAFSDRTVSPSYVNDVVDATAALLEGAAPPGLYHCVNSGSATWLEVTRELARLMGRPNAAITPVPLADAHLHPPRPKFSALSNAKLASVGIVMPTWQDALARYVAQTLPSS